MNQWYLLKHPFRLDTNQPYRNGRDLHELVMYYVSSIKCLLVRQKSIYFGLFYFFAVKG